MTAPAPAELDSIWRRVGLLAGRRRDEVDAYLLEIEAPSGPLRCTVAPDGTRSLLVPVPSADRVRPDSKSRGARVESAVLLEEGVQLPFVRFSCLAAHLNDLFNVLVMEVVDLVERDPVGSALHCNAVLERWRELLRSDGGDVLGRERARGLYGELCVLRELVRIVPSALGTWRGPAGDVHDFVSSDGDLEAKVCGTGPRREFQVSGVGQLEPAYGRPLHLVGMKVADKEDEGETLPDVVAEVMASGVDRLDFVERLSAAGFHMRHADAYRDRRYCCEESRVYRVEAGIPCIVPRSFVGGTLPAGVVSLSYAIDLSPEPPFPLDPEAVSHVYDKVARGGRS